MNRKRVAINRLSWWRTFSIEPRHLVDVGSGLGENAGAFFDCGVPMVSAIDASTPVCPPAGVRWFVGEVPGDHAFELGSADFVFCANVLEHIRPDRIEPFVDECARMLTPGGAAFFSWSPVFSNIGAHVGGRLRNWEHLTAENADAWFKTLASRVSTAYATEWFSHPWRPGLSRDQWLRSSETIATQTTIGEVASAICRRFQILRHNTVSADDGLRDLWPNLNRRFPRASWIDFACISDTYLVRLSRVDLDEPTRRR